MFGTCEESAYANDSKLPFLFHVIYCIFNIRSIRHMKPKEYLMLFALAALWGASFLFIKVAVAEMSPLTLVAVRLIFGALGLLVFVPIRPAIMQGWSTRLRGFFVVAILNGVIPYLAISCGQE